MTNSKDLYDSAAPQIIHLLALGSTDYNQRENNMKKTIASFLSVTIALAGCATSSKNIAANYVSPMQYHAYDCEQLAGETQRIQSRVDQVGGRLDVAATHDQQLVGVGMILFWPALFALGGTKEQEAEYARLKGEYDAVQQAAIAHKCPGVVAQTPTTTTTASASAPSTEKPAGSAEKP
ncbi:MAG: hypothetical protein PHH47_08280 [Gallionella sp.]|nr:hypothetical protein [Gallionella sp.]MDD4945957.1 hypothetical protein [Gallionella sp.]MDD5612036.1 hypothetical protein [Gallionella sp.]